MKTQTEVKHTPYVIRCTDECDETCKAHERGVYPVYDDLRKEFVVVAGHDLLGVEDIDGKIYYGAWWQSFDTFKTEQEAICAIAKAEGK